MTLSYAERVNRDLRHRDWLIDQQVINDMDDAAREERMALIRLNALTCPHCHQSVDATNWQKHFDLYHPDKDASELLSSTPQLPDEEQNLAIVRLDEARALLADLHQVDEVKAIRDKAEAMRVYARQAHLGLEAQNHAAEIKLRAERRAGELLRELEDPRGGDRKSERAKNQKLHDATIDRKPTLADLGISKSQSSRWQAIAALPEATFEAAIAETRSDEKELTTAHVMRVTSLNYKRDNKANRPANQYVPQGHDACQTPPYALDPLLPYIERDWTIWEPAAGEGLIVEALYDSGFTTVERSDLLTGQNFLDYEPERWDCQLTNPPYSLKFDWLKRSYELGKPFALLLPVETLGAKTAQELMQQYGFEIMLLDSRVDFKMPNAGWDGAGAQFPVLWLTWKLLPQPVMFGSIEAGKRAFKP